MMQPLSALHQKIQFVGEHIGVSQRHYCRFGYKLSVSAGESVRQRTDRAANSAQYDPRTL